MPLERPGGADRRVGFDTSLSGVLIALFTIEQLVNGIRNGFDHPEPPDEDLPIPPIDTSAVMRARP